MLKARSRKLTSRFDRKSSPRSTRHLVWAFIAFGSLLIYSIRPSDEDLSSEIDQTQLQELVDSLAQKRQEAAQRALQPPEELEPKNETSSLVSGAQVTVAQTGQKDKPLKSQKFGIVHLGKCGGISIREALAGYVGLQTAVGKVAQRAKWFHLAKPEVQKFQNWILLVRDPISRLQSWWMYDHPDNFLYRQDYLGFPFKSKMWPQLFECYPTLDEFLTEGLAPTMEVSSSDKCKILALMAAPLRGSSYVTGVQHMRFNFDRYFAPLLASKQEETLFVVRAENMLDDLNSINTLLGDKEHSLPTIPHRSHWRTNDYPNKDRSVSAEGMENLCRHLCNEIQHYKQILTRGENLSLESAAKSMQKLAKSCPSQVNSNDCPLGMTEKEWDAMMKEFRVLESEEIQQLDLDRMAFFLEVNKKLPPTPKRKKLQQYRDTALDDSFGFLHFGRAGGQTVRFLLDAHKKSTLHKKLAAGGTWVSTGKPLLWKHRHWVIMVRDPIERVMSWWAYHHPDNLERRPDAKKILALPEHITAERKFLYDCYPSLQELVLDGLKLPTPSGLGAQKYPNEYQVACRQIAQRAIPTLGGSRVPLMDEVDYSYTEHDRDLVFEGKERFFFVIRVEQMVSDLNGIEQMLTRQESTAFQKSEARAFKETTRTKYWPVADPELSANTQGLLCRRLCHNIQTYKKLLRAAINLTEKSYKLSMERLGAYCPTEVENDVCG